MAKFATDCLIKLHELTSSLELTMGPDTADLDIRVGLHSGPVTAGVLRGDKGRFQLFGDSMNMASRIESTGCRSKIHLSEDTANLMKKAGKEHWLTLREDPVFAKGKGVLTTYWLDITSNATSNETDSVVGMLPIQATAEGGSTNNGIFPPMSPRKLKRTADARINALKEENHNKRMERLVSWTVDVLAKELKLVVAKRVVKGQNLSPQKRLKDHPSKRVDNLLDEVQDVVPMLDVDDSTDFESKVDLESIQLDPTVEGELHEYVSVIAELYHRNSFHNFEHAGHVLMSTVKLLTRIVTPREYQTGSGSGSGDDDSSTGSEEWKDFAVRLHKDSYGIASDPLCRFACAFR